MGRTPKSARMSTSKRSARMSTSTREAQQPSKPPPPKTKETAKEVHMRNITDMVESEFCDLRMKINGKVKGGVRLLWAAQSPTIAKMVRKDYKEGKLKTLVNMPDVTEDAFVFIHKSIHGMGSEKLSAALLPHVYYAAKAYQIQSVIVQCEEYLNSQLSKEDWLKVVVAVDKYNDFGIFVHLLEKIMSQADVMSKIGDVLLEETQLLSLSRTTLAFILDQDLLAASEDKIWNMCWKWSEFNTTKENTAQG